MKLIDSANKRRIYKLLLPFIRIFFSLFFEKQYLKGKYFDESLIGWRWAFKGIVWQKIFGFNRNIPWPVSPFITLYNPKNIIFNINDLNNFQTYGTYFQNFTGKIIVGEGTYIGPNVGIITVNHDIENLNLYQQSKDVILGKNCWIGMNAILLPGVILGEHTIVGAGAVVTKPFPKGHLVIAGNPARVIKNLPDFKSIDLI